MLTKTNANIELNKATKKLSQAANNVYKSSPYWNNKEIGAMFFEILNKLSCYSMCAGYAHNAYAHTTAESLRDLANLLDAAAKKS